jgi:hypothetical protein
MRKPISRRYAASVPPHIGQGAVMRRGLDVEYQVIAIDGDGQRHAVHELAGRHGRPRTEGDFLPLFVAERGLDFEETRSSA